MWSLRTSFLTLPFLLRIYSPVSNYANFVDNGHTFILCLVPGNTQRCDAKLGSDTGAALILENPSNIAYDSNNSHVLVIAASLKISKDFGFLYAFYGSSLSDLCVMLLSIVFCCSSREKL
ncbi:uncharacterized protein LOC132053559 [Lycium ferocissimum]|uniref:uncharacterized protein LOC132053559 n=1 Tax=Lycium ferocissimum TaxID=112874 RepID=UPI002815F823|nr:uncharacterized protein LOC132053559 [Lycium ferocissimum]